MKKILTIILVVLLLLVGCAQPSAPTPTLSPTTTVPSVRDFAIYPEDKVALEKAETDIELNRKGDILVTVTDSQGKPALLLATLT